MKRLLAVCLMLASLLPTTVTGKDSRLANHVKNAVAILYSQDVSGGMNMHCTVTAFQRIDSVDPTTKKSIPAAYRFATAAHCIGPDDRTKERAADTKNAAFFITFDEGGTDPKRFWPARPIFVGYQSRGEDFAEFEVKSTEVWTIVPLGDERKAKDGDDFVNVSAPLGLGKQTFAGQISSLFLDRPLIQGDINWRGSIALQIVGINGGSSGSAIVHADQEAIIGFLVGMVGGSTTIAVPVSKFIAVRKAVFDGKYRYYQPIVNTNPDGTDSGN
jgi:hypothetical protein